MKTSLYSVSIWAMRPLARLSMPTRMPSSIRLSARQAGAVSVVSAMRMTAAAPEARRSKRASASSPNPATSPTAPRVSVIAREPMVGIRKKVVPSVPTMEPAVETPPIWLYGVCLKLSNKRNASFILQANPATLSLFFSGNREIFQEKQGGD
jgi:hypothetical protein